MWGLKHFGITRERAEKPCWTKEIQIIIKRVRDFIPDDQTQQLQLQHIGDGTLMLIQPLPCLCGAHCIKSTNGVRNMTVRWCWKFSEKNPALSITRSQIEQRRPTWHWWRRQLVPSTSSSHLYPCAKRSPNLLKFTCWIMPLIKMVVCIKMAGFRVTKNVQMPGALEIRTFKTMPTVVLLKVGWTSVD